MSKYATASKFVNSGRLFSKSTKKFIFCYFVCAVYTISDSATFPQSVYAPCSMAAVTVVVGGDGARGGGGHGVDVRQMR